MNRFRWTVRVGYRATRVERYPLFLCSQNLLRWWRILNRDHHGLRDLERECDIDYEFVSKGWLEKVPGQRTSWEEYLWKAQIRLISIPKDTGEVIRPQTKRHARLHGKMTLERWSISHVGRYRKIPNLISRISKVYLNETRVDTRTWRQDYLELGPGSCSLLAIRACVGGY